MRERRAGEPLRVRPLAAGFWMPAAAGLAALAIWVTTAWLLGVAEDARPGTERAQIRMDAVRTGLAAGGGAAAAVGLMLAFRRQRHAELATALGEQDAAERRITELYNAAAEQLGSDKAPVRLAALYTLERLANGNERHRQTIVNIICAYLRMPCTPPCAPGPGSEEEHRERARRNAARYRAARTGQPAPARFAASPGPDPHEEHQVRLTAQRLLHTHLRPDAPVHWSGIDLDLTGAALTGFDLTGCHLHTADFTDTAFTGDTVFSGATFVREAVFSGASFSGDAWFSGATFTGDAVFIGASFAGDAWFREAAFTRPAVFIGAAFTGSAVFSGAAFTGHAGFIEATFTADAWFSGAGFGRDARFGGATFTGDAVFSGAAFTGPARFGEAIFPEKGVDLEAATAADTALAHEVPPRWRIEPAEGPAGRFVPAPEPAAP